jgi:hypothetical protein
MDKTNMNDAAIEPRDPHAASWMEHQRLAAEHHNRYLVRAEEANADDERRYRRLDELEDLLRNTPVTTFEGSRIQLMVLALAIEDGLRHDDLKGVLGNLSCFMNDIERALERHQLKEQAQRWCWEARVPNEPPWASHLGTPADAEEISRALNPARERDAHGGITEAKLSRRGKAKATLDPASARF